MSDLDHLRDVWSDTYKDAHGVRPRHSTAGWTAEDFRREIRASLDVIEAEMFPAEGDGWRFDGDPAALDADPWAEDPEFFDEQNDWGGSLFGMCDDEIPLAGEDY